MLQTRYSRLHDTEKSRVVHLCVDIMLFSAPRQKKRISFSTGHLKHPYPLTCCLLPSKHTFDSTSVTQAFQSVNVACCAG